MSRLLSHRICVAIKLIPNCQGIILCFWDHCHVQQIKRQDQAGCNILWSQETDITPRVQLGMTWKWMGCYTNRLCNESYIMITQSWAISPRFVCWNWVWISKKKPWWPIITKAANIKHIKWQRNVRFPFLLLCMIWN